MVDMIRTRMTAQEFMLLPETNLPTELLNGELFQMSSPIIIHQRISRRLVIVLNGLIPNGEVFYAPLDVYFDDFNVVQPDVMWVAEGSQCVVLEKHLRGAPDLIIEILSPGTNKRDRQGKFRLYQQFGVREYWIIDPIEQLIEVWQLVDGKFNIIDVYSSGETLSSPLLGEIKVDTILSDSPST